MAWLRLDDGFTKHPKFEGWSVSEKWAWLEVMEYCARYETNGRIPVDLTLMPRSTTPRLLAKAESAGWVDVHEDGSKWVHDWAEFNPVKLEAEAIDERVREAYEAFPEASANDIAKMIGGRRKAVLEAIRRFRGGSYTPPSSGFPGGSQGGSVSGTGNRREPVTRAHPVPSPVLRTSSTPTNYVDAAEDDPEPVAVAPGSTGTLPVAEPEGVLRSV